MNAPQVVDKFLMGSSPESNLVSEDIGRMERLIQAAWRQGALHERDKSMLLLPYALRVSPFPVFDFVFHDLDIETLPGEEQKYHRGRFL